MLDGKKMAENEIRSQIQTHGGKIGGLVSQLVRGKQDLSITILDNQILFLK